MMRWSNIPRHPSDSTLRQFATIWLIAFSALGIVERLRGHGWAALLFGALALIASVPGMARPRTVRGLYVGWMMLAFPVGWLISNTVLLILFFGIFTPVGLLMRLLGRDALRIRTKPGGSYWRSRRQPASVEQYFRQS